MSYHFVKFGNTWYLKPESTQDIIDHFQKICGREIKDGVEDYFNNMVLVPGIDGKPYWFSKNHSSSVWRNAVEQLAGLKCQTYLQCGNTLENETLQDRLRFFLEGRFIYLRDGLPYYIGMEIPEYDEEVWSDELVYPYEYNYDDVRFLQWPNGIHWYAKIGGMDIVDKYGNQKWRDKSYAIEIAKRFCECGGDWSKDKSKY